MGTEYDGLDATLSILPLGNAVGTSSREITYESGDLEL